MKLQNSILGLRLCPLEKYFDERGFFAVPYHEKRMYELGITIPFVQDNLAFSTKGTLRGMHFQSSPGQAKFITVLSGEICDVVVDIRKDSPHFGRHEMFTLDPMVQLFVPIGFAHGYLVLSEEALVHYKVSALFDPTTEKGFFWNDPEIGIQWPITPSIVSVRDRSAPSFNEIQKHL